MSTRSARRKRSGSTRPRPQDHETVLLVANYRPGVGFAWWLMENFWLRFARIARDRGLQPVIAYPKEGTIPEAIERADIETIVFPFPGSGLEGLSRTLRLIRDRRIRCIYLTDRGYTRFEYILFRLAGVRLILNHDHTPGDRPFIGGMKGLIKAALRRFEPASCDLQICVSPMIRERAVENARIPRDRTTVVQNGIEPIECPQDEHRDSVLDEFEIPPDGLVCVNVSRAQKYKRVGFLIDVAKRCRDELKLEDLYFIHCGSGPDLPRLRKMIDERELSDRFVLAGYRSDVPRILCAADFALHPAKGEAFSLAILEYMSAGLATLVPDIPTVSQAIQHGSTGIIYEDGDADQAARFLARLRDDPQRRERLGSNASSMVRRRYSLDSMNRDFDRVIERELDKHLHPR